MTQDFSFLNQRLNAAKAQLDQALEKASQDLIRFKRNNQPTAQEQQAMQQAALRGELGDDMRELARKIERGEDNWNAVFEGRSPNVDLLQGHLNRMAQQHREAIRESIEEDENFDPTNPPPLS
jgi:capsule polysaccharide export protein KpsE/RkpR